MTKHIPVLTITGSTVRVQVGAEAHPMEPEHFIEWIALYSGDTELTRVTLQPGSAPEAVFEGVENPTSLKARAHCNLHGTWES